MKIALQRCLLVLFAALQCIAPITHAHTHVSDESNNTYYFHASHTQAQTTSISIPVDEDQAVFLPDSYHHRDMSVDLTDSRDTIAPSLYLQLLAVAPYIYTSAYRAYYCRPVLNSSCWPQAPPLA